VKNNDVLEDGMIYVGVPAKPRGTVSDDYKVQWTRFKGIYSDLARERYPRSLKRME